MAAQPHVVVVAAPGEQSISDLDGEPVLPFGPPMTRPEKLTQVISGYTKEAVEHRIEGVMLIKCIITRQGEVKRCRVLQTLPYLESSALDALSQTRFKPVTLDGQPVNVDYTFTLRFSLPPPPPQPRGQEG